MKPNLKKVLIITYYWPPAGGPGVQRWLKFAKYLPNFGIEPIIYIPENPTYPIIDNELVKEIPENIIILKKFIWEPYNYASIFSRNKTKKMSSGIITNKKKQTFLEKFFLWIRGNFFIPDARIFWVLPSVSYLEKYIKKNNIDTIITTGPPHSLHLIGLELKKKMAIKWFADFRDPWTTIGYHNELKLLNFTAKVHKKMESKVLNSADAIIVTSETTKKEFQIITQKPIEIITNGFDNAIVTDAKLDIKFSLAHIGSLLSGRNPVILWESLSELVFEIPDFANHLEIKLIGTVSQDIINSITENKLFPYLKNIGYVSHNEAIAQQRSSQILLLIEIDSENTKSIIPGKLFEYIISGRPIIGIGPENSDFSKIIEETNTGQFFKYDEKSKLKNVILCYYNLFLENKLKVNSIGIEKYSRKNLTEKLANLIFSK